MLKVLFLCAGNSCHSQMAVGVAAGCLFPGVESFINRMKPLRG